MGLFHGAYWCRSGIHPLATSFAHKKCYAAGQSILGFQSNGVSAFASHNPAHTPVELHPTAPAQCALGNFTADHRLSGSVSAPFTVASNADACESFYAQPGDVLSTCFLQSHTGASRSTKCACREIH